MRVSWRGLVVCTAILLACGGDDDEKCDDGADNDGNGLIDCADPACPAGTACGASGLKCTAAQTCECPTGASCTSPLTSDPNAILGSMRVGDSPYPSVMGARYSGYNEQIQISFEVLAASGKPFPAGLPVTFTHVPVGGSYIGAAPACTEGPFPTCTATCVTGADGVATVTLTSGRHFGVLAVRAEATLNGVQVSAVADNIAVVGAKPNGAHIGMDCRPLNVPAFTEHDCMVSNYAGEGSTIDCILSVADRHGIAVGVPSLVAFMSEAGAAGAPVLTRPYDPTNTTPTYSPRVGEALGYVAVRDQPLPWDVDPAPGEYSSAVDFGCGPVVANPRDGIVTVIGMVVGEEGFVDLNGNGVYDGDEPFVDIGEPFVDANDNGRWDLAEPFQDVNGNGVYDGPNGSWDEDTVLWTQTRIVYSGYPSNLLIYGQGTPPFSMVPATSFNGDARFDVYVADHNFNPLSALARYAPGTMIGNATAKTPLAPEGGAETLGAMFRLLYCDQNDANCVYGPAATACTTTPCHVVPELFGFAYGMSFDLIVDCSRAGPEEAYVTATLNGVRIGDSVPGTCP